MKSVISIEFFRNKLSINSLNLMTINLNQNNSIQGDLQLKARM